MNAARPKPARKPARRATDRKAGESKQEQIVRLMERPKGATGAEIQKLTGWKADSVRGFVSAYVKKKLGLTVTATKVDGGRCYRIGA